MTGPTSNLTRGRRAEALAASCIEERGLSIIERNWRRPEAEIDLVARDADGTVVFVEVRSRTGELYGHPLESIGRTKRRRIVAAAQLFLSEVPLPATGYRFDVVSVLFDPTEANPPKVEYVPAAFTLDDL